jgi:hypothetical protein
LNVHRLIAALTLTTGLVFSGLSTSILGAATPGGDAEYVGGTIGDFKVGLKGQLYTSHRTQFYFATKGGSFAIPYDRINLVEYGQSVGRRYAAAILISPLLLASKSRRHFMTVGFVDESGEQQAAVFRVDKKAIRVMLVSLEARTGLKVAYQDEDARKAGKG